MLLCPGFSQVVQLGFGARSFQALTGPLTGALNGGRLDEGRSDERPLVLRRESDGGDVLMLLAGLGGDGATRGGDVVLVVERLLAALVATVAVLPGAAAGTMSDSNEPSNASA